MMATKVHTGLLAFDHAFRAALSAEANTLTYPLLSQQTRLAVDSDVACYLSDR